MLDAAQASHGVTLADLDAVTDLPGAAVDVIGGRYRRDIPQTPTDAVALLDAVATELGQLGIPTVRDELVVPMPRGEHTPVWGRSGRAQLAVTIDINGGWGAILLDEMTTRSPVVGVVAPYSTAGAEAVARLTMEVNDGERENPFVRK